MNVRKAIWIGLPLLLVTLILVVYRYWFAIAPSPPMIDYPATLDLGDREMGEQVTTRFSISNTGCGELVITDIRTNCNCAGLEQESKGTLLQVKRLQLSAGDRVDLVMRISIGGVPIGASMRNTVEFRTNDPNAPIGRIVATVRQVSGGVYANPRHVYFGTIAQNEIASQMVEIRDTAIPARIIEKITSSDPERFSVQFIPLADTVLSQKKHVDGVITGRCQVILNTTEPGEVHGYLTIYLVEAFGLLTKY
ncbi:MAG: DUF1573 domain-containing protein [Gemmataceae bacterium]|nr:DUF1573 domain-containing protein [Gemmataceae bacterium]MCI0738966.1 DUF1573 domain-containing protein [Gemmataceae bacterium]